MLMLLVLFFVSVWILLEREAKTRIYMQEIFFLKDFKDREAAGIDKETLQNVVAWLTAVERRTERRSW